MDLTLIQGTISGLKTASDIARGFMALKTEAEIQAKVIELQSVILNAQSSALAANADQSATADEIRTLKEKLANAESWNQERGRYALLAVDTGVYAYALRKSSADGEPPHWLCARCFNEGKKTVLQSGGESQYFGTDYACHTCKSTIRVGNGLPGPALA
jgi:negative regulator of replication initiation